MKQGVQKSANRKVDSKVEAASNPTTFRTSFATDEEISEILEDMADPPQGRIGVFAGTKEVSEIIFKGSRHTRRFITGQSPLTAAMFVNLAREAWRRGDRRFVDMLMPIGATITVKVSVSTNGSVDDELGQKTEYEGKMREAFNAKRFVEAQYWNDMARAVQSSIDDEIAKEASK